jgi:hypothetical protein
MAQQLSPPSRAEKNEPIGEDIGLAEDVAMASPPPAGI